MTKDEQLMPSHLAWLQSGFSQAISEPYTLDDCLKIYTQAEVDERVAKGQTYDEIVGNYNMYLDFPESEGKQ